MVMISRWQLGTFILLALFILRLLLQTRSAVDPLRPSQLMKQVADARSRKFTLLEWRSQTSQLTKVFCVVAVTSPAHLPERRSWQRVQWDKSLAILREQYPDATPTYIFKFCLGSDNFSQSDSYRMKEEQKVHGDIVFVSSPDFDTQYWGDITVHGRSATTMKVLAALQWAVSYYEFQYIVRLGDDSYFRPERFFSKVQMGLLPNQSACIGQRVAAYTQDDPRFGQVIAPYPSGMGFVLTHDVAVWILEAKKKLLLGGPEDAVVGSWFVGTDIQIYHVPTGFRDLEWSCHPGEDILVHCLREQAHWDLIDPDGNLPC